jgi:beta-glucanase (GH16 family)
MSTWSHEFEGPAGAPPDATVWDAERGGGGWGDDQKQFYTAPPANAVLTGDGLAITARADAAVPGGISSARLTTRGKVALRYGRFAARIRVPSGLGVWPAFWMLGTDIDEVGWPACGEIDVMEHVGSDPTAVFGTVHGSGYAGVGRGIGRRHPSGSILADDFHIYGVDWGRDHVAWHLDGREYFRVTPESLPGPWPFDHFFFLILNLAFGGRWPGNDPAPSSLPAGMLVDWVRVTGTEVRHGVGQAPHLGERFGPEESGGGRGG